MPPCKRSKPRRCPPKKSRAGRYFPNSGSGGVGLDTMVLPSKRAAKLANEAVKELHNEGDLGMLYAEFALGSLQEAECAKTKVKKLEKLDAAFTESEDAKNTGGGSLQFLDEEDNLLKYIADSVSRIVSGKDGALRSTVKVGENPLKVKINEKISEKLVTSGKADYKSPLFGLYRNKARGI